MLMFVRNLLPPPPRAAAIWMLSGLLCISSAPPGTAAEEDTTSRDVKLETVTVTAEKREEDVQKVTTSITVLSDVAIRTLKSK